MNFKANKDGLVTLRDCDGNPVSTGRGRIGLPGGDELFWEDNGVGGRTYTSTEVGTDGCIVWDTCIVQKSTLEAAMYVESMLQFIEEMEADDD